MTDELKNSISILTQSTKDMKGYLNFVLLSVLVMTLLWSCGEKEKEVPATLTVAPNELSGIVSQGETKSIKISSTGAWSVSGTSSWCVVSPESGPAGDTNVTITVRENTETTERTATLTFTSGVLRESVKVTQVGATILKSNRDKLQYSYQGGTQTIELTASAAWSAASSTEWCTLDKNSGTGDDVIKITTTENGETSARSAQVTFTMGALKVSIEISQEGISLDAIIAAERAALNDFYQKAGGRDWERSAGWGTDEPLSKWYGITTNDEGRVREIDLTGNKLIGSISPELCKLSKLRVLKLQQNNLSGATIPENFGDLTELQELNLGQTLIGGTLPKSMSKLTKLTELNLENNPLEGEFPEFIYGLTELKFLSLNRTNFSGGIDKKIGNLKNLKNLSVAFVKGMNGSIDFIYEMVNVERIYINSCNFTGELTKDIKKLTKLSKLQLSSNQLTGNIPVEILELKDLTYFDIAKNKLSGVLPQAILDANKVGGVFDFSDKWGWNKVFDQQDGYGFSNAPVKPE